MKDTLFKVKSNRLIAKNTYECVLVGDTSDITAAGQFVNIKLDGFYLRRPISVCDLCGDELTLIYKVVGKPCRNTLRTKMIVPRFASSSIIPEEISLVSSTLAGIWIAFRYGYFRKASASSNV